MTTREVALEEVRLSEVDHPRGRARLFFLENGRRPGRSLEDTDARGLLAITFGVVNLKISSLRELASVREQTESS